MSMRRVVPSILCLVTLACGSSSPTAPSPAPSVPTTPAPAPAPIVPTQPTRDPALFSQAFWNCFVHNACERGNEPLRRLTSAPMIYLRTVDDLGVAMDPVTLSTVQNALQAVASTWGGGQFGLAGIQRGADSMDGRSGWITVHFLGTNSATFCGQSTVGADGGFIKFNDHNPAPACRCQSSSVSPHVAKHELGHVFGYWHTDRVDDLMDPTVTTCDGTPSAREVYHASLAYTSPQGTTTALPGVSRVIID